MMEPTQLNGQVGQQQNSPIQNGHPNGHAISQKTSHDGLEGVSVVAIKDDEEQCSLKSLAHHLHSPSSSTSSSESSSSLNGDETFINGSQHLPSPNMQPVDIDVSNLTTASNASTSISAALVSSSPVVSPTTPTPSSVSLMLRQRLHPSPLDAISGQTSLEAPLLESIDTPKQSGDVYSSAGTSKDDGGDGEGIQQGTKIIIPDPSTLVPSIDTNVNSNPLPSSIPNSTTSTPAPTSRPTSTVIDTALFSNRPAPPSPALSRRVSGAPSIASSTHSSASNSRPRSRSSITRRPSMGASRASLRMSGVGSDARRQSLGNQLNQFERSIISSLPVDPLNNVTFTPSPSSTQQATSSTTMTAPSVIPDATISPTTTLIPNATLVSDPVPTTAITPTATSSLPEPSPTLPAPAPARIYIKVRDFGFPPSDERHLGLGDDIPKANRVHRLNRKLGGPDRATARAAAAALDPSSSSAGMDGGRSRRTDSIGSMGSMDSSDADAEEEEEEDDGGEGWGGIGISGWGKGGSSSKGWDGFKLGMGRFSWSIRSNHSNIQNGNEDGSDKDKTLKGTSTSTTTTMKNGIFPSRKDLDMNFMDSSSSSSDDDDDDDDKRRGRRRANDQGITEEFDDDDDDFDVDDRDGEDGEYEYEEPQEPLYPGLYRALYAFEPEGVAEMELDEDQIVRVVGRGGGIGWAVVVDERGGDEVEGKVQVKHALVPEGYLEAVRLDCEDEEEEEGFEVVENKDGDGDGDAVVVNA